MDLVRDPLSPTRETFGGKKRKTALSLSLSWENKKTLFPSYQKSVLISLSRSLSLSLSLSLGRAIIDRLLMRVAFTFVCSSLFLVPSHGKKNH